MRWLALCCVALLACVSSTSGDSESPATAARAGEDGSAARCWNNADCSSGQHCIIPEGAIQGMCADKVDELGMPDHSVPMPTGSEETEGCSFDTDCPVMLRCEKLDALHGVCVKR